MGKQVEARIDWIPKEQGGRQELPFGDKYAPIIKITDSLVESTEIWSAFVIIRKKLNENETIAEIKYLSDMAPDNLCRNVRFELYEGNKVVAKGVIL